MTRKCSAWARCGKTRKGSGDQYSAGGEQGFSTVHCQVLIAAASPTGGRVVIAEGPRRGPVAHSSQFDADQGVGPELPA